MADDGKSARGPSESSVCKRKSLAVECLAEISVVAVPEPERAGVIWPSNNANPRVCGFAQPPLRTGVPTVGDENLGHVE